MSDRHLLSGCVGCRVCEMACGYHHTGSFNYASSSIRIEKTPDGFVLNYCAGEEQHRHCDCCDGLAEPLCVHYCPHIHGQDALKTLANYWLEHHKEGGALHDQEHNGNHSSGESDHR